MLSRPKVEWIPHPLKRAVSEPASASEEFTAYAARSIGDIAHQLKSNSLKSIIEDIHSGAAAAKLGTQNMTAQEKEIFIQGELDKLMKTCRQHTDKNKHFEKFDSGPEVKTGCEKKFEEVKKMMDVWESKSYLGNKFRKDCKAQGNNVPTGKEEMKDFRDKWLKTQLDKYSEKKTEVQASKKTERSKGTYRTFGRLVLDLGGWDDAQAVKGAINATQKCAALGEPWAKIHPQTEMLIFLVIDEETEEEFSQSWSILRQEVSDGALQDDANDDDATGGAESSTTAPPTKKPKPAAKACAEKPAETAKACANKKLLNGFRAASKVKAMYANASAAYLMINENKWEWAQGSKIEAKLQESWADVGNSMGDWHKEFLREKDINVLKRKYSEARLLVELQSFAELQDKIEKVDTTCQKMEKANAEFQGL